MELWINNFLDNFVLSFLGTGFAYDFINTEYFITFISKKELIDFICMYLEDYLIAHRSQVFPQRDLEVCHSNTIRCIFCSAFILN